MKAKNKTLEAIEHHIAEQAAVDAEARSIAARRKHEESMTAKHEIRNLVRKQYGVVVKPEFMDVSNETFCRTVGLHSRRYEHVRPFWFLLEGYEFRGEFIGGASSITAETRWDSVRISYRRWNNLSIENLKKVIEGGYSFTLRDRVRAYFNEI